MIVIALTIALLIGGGVSSLMSKQLKSDRKHAGDVLKGADVRSQALETLDSMRKTSTESLKMSQKLGKEALKAARDHDRPSAEIGSLVQDQVARIADLDRAFLDQRDRLHGLLTREQWDAVFQDTTAHEGN